MWWGYSQPLDLRQEIRENEDDDLDVPLEVLILGSGDARHIVKTIASAYKHKRRSINFHVIEPFLEQIARSILLLSTILEVGLGLQEATRYYLELMGNILLRPATAKYLVQRVQSLIDIPTQSVNCPWVNLEKLKHKDRDSLESIFKFWIRATCEGIPIMEYWDRRIRKALEVRYDCREGVFDWDYHMVLKYRENTNLTLHEYRFWRGTGIAFTWIEGEPARSNPTLINNIISHGKGFIHYAYMGDINVGPYFTWSLGIEKKKEKQRATDIAEREVMRAIHETRCNEPMCEDVVAAHRDPSLLNAVIITEIPNNDIEQETWSTGDEYDRRKRKIVWKNIPDFKVIFHPLTAINKYKNKQEFIQKFDLIWIAHNMTKHLSNVIPLAKLNARILVESRKFMVDLRKEDLEKFTKELINDAKENGMETIHKFDSEKDNIARFLKRSVVSQEII
ncbi:dynein axonemal assembly factor 3 [Diprion similis]|uniref:dynein axonemal assembly factor 3 n=1 Tax=Diprion similis TaxID=362088 RepID=UPI001EF9300D|nr:dynein axonemal assembly factor 3 [Diprion similis]